MRYPSYVTIPVAALAAAGMLDLLFERVVYRIGIHVPRDEAAVQAYRGATMIGDGAFRYTVVLAVLAAIVAGSYLLQRRAPAEQAAGIALIVVAAADTLSVRFGGAMLGLVIGAMYAGALALLAGVAIGGRGAWQLRALTVTAGAALVAGQYATAAARAGELWQLTPPAVPAALTFAEAGVLATAVLLFAAARPWAHEARGIALGAGVVAAAVLAFAWLRAPATVAILSLWGTGVTLSFPAPVYPLALGAAVAACVTLARSPGSRLVAVAALLLLVAGVQPTVTQYNLAALLAMTLLALPSPAARVSLVGAPQPARPAMTPTAEAAIAGVRR